MTSAADLVVGLIKVSGCDHQIALPIALKAGARGNVKHAIGAVAITGVVAALQDFEVVDVFGVNLRPQIGGDIRVGNGDTVNQPQDLVAAIHVKHVVRDIGRGHVIGDHLHAVRAVSSRGLLDVLSVQQRCRRGRVHGCFYRSARHHDVFLRLQQRPA